MANSWCYRCHTKSPNSPRKHGWHSITSASGVVRCCPACASSMGLPPPTQLPARILKAVLEQKMPRRTLLNKLVKQQHLHRGELTAADLETEKVTIDKVVRPIAGSSSVLPLPYDLGYCAITSFSMLTPGDNPGPVYYRMEGTQLAWFIWARPGSPELKVKVKVKLDRNGIVIL